MASPARQEIVARGPSAVWNSRARLSILPAMRALILTTLALVAVMTATLAWAAESPKLIGKYQDWDAFTFVEDGKLICYMASEPKKTQPNNVKRGDIYILVTRRPAHGIVDEVSIYAGYPYQAESEVEVTIGDQSFRMFTYENTAWARDPDGDKAIARAMIRGNTMRVKGLSQRGTTTIDTYSLRGFTAATKAIRKACGS